MRPLRLLPILVSILLAIAPAPGCRAPSSPEPSGSTTVYLSEAEALKVVFPDAARVVEEDVVLSPEERRSIEERAEEPLAEAAFTVRAGVRKDGGLDGFAVIASEVGKFRPFEFIVGLEPDGSVRRVAVLVYREERGSEVAHRRFLVQFEGKTAADPIRLNRDVLSVSGATMSVNAVSRGVRKVLALIDARYVRHPERIARFLREGRPAAPAGRTGAAMPRSGGGEPEEVREARYVMGSLCEVRAYGDPLLVREAIARAFREVEAADAALSDYREASELSRVSRSAGRGAVPVSPLTAEFLDLAEHISRESAGAFDITVGPLVDAWGLRRGAARPPRRDELEALRPLVGHDKVSVTPRREGGADVSLARAGMRLDPGALGKGFAVDLAARRLAADGVKAALVDFSGNMYALGAPPGRTAWRVAVRDPARPERMLGIVDLRDRAISSSGSYEKWVEAGGQRRGHILSPRTLEPVDGVLGATVTAPRAALADGYSTACCVLGPDAPAFLAARSGVEGFVAVVDAQGNPRYAATPGWRLE